MDPKDPKAVIREGWIERIRDTQDNTSTPDNTYAYERLYADGTYVLEYYRRGTEGIRRTETTVNTDQQRTWKDAQTQAGKEQAASAKNKVRSYTGTDPRTGRPAKITEYEDGSVDYDEIAPEKTPTAAEQHAAALQQQRERNAALPPEQDPAYETDEERRKRGEARIKEQGAAAQEAEERAERERKESSAANKGTTTLKPDGKGGTIAVTTYPDGRAPTVVPVPGVPSETASTYKEVRQDPNTGRWFGLTTAGWEEIAGGGPGIKAPESAFATEPAGAPPVDVSYGNVSGSLVKYRDFLNQQVQLHDKDPSQGLTREAATRLMEARLKQAEAVMREQQGVVSTQQSLYGTNVTQRGQSLREVESRRTAGTGYAETVLGQMLPLMQHLPGGTGEAFAQALLGLMGYGRRNAAAWGGMADVPEIRPGPALQTAGSAPMPGGTFVAPYVAPAAAEAPAAPGEPAAAPPPATPEQALPPPLLGPPPAVEGPLVAPTPAPPFNPPATDPGHDPRGGPVGMAPGSFVGQYAGLPSPRQPSSELQRLLDDPDMPNELVLQAFLELYPAGLG